MLGRKLVRGVGMAVMASALVTGTLGVVGITAAHAASTAFYVAPLGDGGNDTANNCTLQAKPCATIGHALSEEATLSPNSPGSVINLAKGTYNSGVAGDFFNTIVPANSGVTIDGAGIKGKKTSTVAPSTCAQLSHITVADGIYPPGAGGLVVFNAGENGITVENLVLNGANVSTCPGYEAGVWITGGTTGDAAVQDLIESGATYGILTDADADSTIISNVLAPVLCSTTVKGPNTGLNAGWTTPANLQIKALPKCEQFIESGHGAATGVFVNGVAYCMTTSATKKTLVLTGTPTALDPCATTGGLAISNSGGLEIATGATVIFNTSVAPFLNWGIACNSPLNLEIQSTDCAISDNTVTAGGSVLGDFPSAPGFPPVGILATGGATADIDGNSVSDVADAILNDPVPGATTNDGIGIGLLPDGMDGCSAGNSQVGVNDHNSPTTGHGNTLGSTSANDVGIAVVGNSSPLCTDANPAYEVNNNTVSAANEAGIALTNLGNPFGGHLQDPLSSNSVGGVTEGVGIEAEGITNQTIGGVLSTEGNTESSSGLGLVIAPCSSTACQSALNGGTPTLGLKSSGNLVQNNSFSGNIAYGELTVGSYQVNELATQIPTLVAGTLSGSGNTFNANNWGTPTSATNGTLPSEIDGSEVEDGTGWDGGCVSETGDCPVSSLVYEGANTTFGPAFPGSATFTLSVCDATLGQSENLPAGTEITFNTPNNLLNLGPQEANDGGTFFVTQAAIITGNTGGCGVGSNSNQWANVSLQAIAPARVGTLAAPAGQPYILATGDTIYVNANGNVITQSLNSYGHGANSNSCTPAGAVGTTVATEVPSNIFGETDPPFTQLSTTLQASTGGVNATYVAC